MSYQTFFVSADERCEDMIDHRSYSHNLAAGEIKSLKKSQA